MLDKKNTESRTVQHVFSLLAPSNAPVTQPKGSRVQHRGKWNVGLSSSTVAQSRDFVVALVSDSYLHCIAPQSSSKTSGQQSKHGGPPITESHCWGTFRSDILLVGILSTENAVRLQQSAVASFAHGSSLETIICNSHMGCRRLNTQQEFGVGRDLPASAEPPNSAAFDMHEYEEIDGG